MKFFHLTHTKQSSVHGRREETHKSNQNQSWTSTVRPWSPRCTSCPWENPRRCCPAGPARTGGRFQKRILLLILCQNARNAHDSQCREWSRLPAFTGQRGSGGWRGAHPAGPGSASPRGGSAGAGQGAVTSAAPQPPTDRGGLSHGPARQPPAPQAAAHGGPNAFRGASQLSPGS